MKTNTVHEQLVQAHVAAAIRAVLAICAVILAHMAMNKGGGGGMQNRTGAGEHGQQAWHGKGGQARHGKTRPLQQKQPANEVTGTGLEATTPADDPTGTGLAVNSWQTIRPAQALQLTAGRRSGRHRPCSKTAGR